MEPKLTDLKFIDLKMMFTMFRNDGISEMVRFESSLPDHDYINMKLKLIKELQNKYDTSNDADFEKLMIELALAISQVEYLGENYIDMADKEFIQKIAITIRSAIGDNGVVLHSRKAIKRVDEALDKLDSDKLDNKLICRLIALMIIECQDDLDLVDYYHIIRLIGENKNES